MTIQTGTSAETGARAPSARQIAVLRRASLGTLVMLVIQYGIGIGVNLYVAVPAADHNQGFAKAISNGPAAITVHIVVGLLLIVAAAVLLVRAIVARHVFVIVTSAIGLVAILGAASAGTDFVRSGHDASSMTMAILAGVALLCYGLSLYVLASSRRVTSGAGRPRAMG